MGHLVGWAGGACHKFGMGEGPSPATPTGGAQKSGDNLEDTHQRPKRKQQTDVSIINIAASGHLHVCVRVRRHSHHARLVNQWMPPPTGSHCSSRNATLILIRHRTRAVLVHMSIPRPRPSCLVASGATAHSQIPHRKGSWSREDPPALCCRLCRHRSQAKPPRLPCMVHDPCQASSICFGISSSTGARPLHCQTICRRPSAILPRSSRKPAAFAKVFILGGILSSLVRRDRTSTPSWAASTNSINNALMNWPLDPGLQNAHLLHTTY